MAELSKHRTQRSASGDSIARCAAAGALALAIMVSPTSARGQATSALEGRVLDALQAVPVHDASLELRPLASDAALLTAVRHARTDSLGRYVYSHLPYGRYVLRVQRFGYHAVELELTLERSEPLALSVLLDPAAFPLDPLALRGLRRRGPSLVPRPPGSARVRSAARSALIRERQQRFVTSDVRQLSPADISEANTLAEDDVFRALQSVPGVARRDDFTADLWTRGASAGQTTVYFDGVPIVGALHALGILSGVNSDMLHEATFQPGIAPASHQGGAAGVIDLESRSPAQGGRARSVAISPVSIRATMDGVVSDRIAWAVGARRSHVDLLSAFADGLMPGEGTLQYAFRDVTARADVFITPRWRLEASAFAQDDRAFGSVGGLVDGNRGEWGAGVARATLVGGVHGLTVRSTFGLSAFDATVRASEMSEPEAVHPPTDNSYRTLLWDAQIEDGATWSAGVSARHDRHGYDGPDVDPASLLTRDLIERNGFPQLAPIALAIARGRRIDTDEATRLALWGSRHGRLGSSLRYDAGVRLEGGNATSDGNVRVAPRLAVRYEAAGTPLLISAAYGRAYQYTQSVSRTDVLRSGLRVSEVMVQADRETAPLRSDVLTLGGELWHGDAWLFGATAWWRASAGLLLPQPEPGPLTERQPTIRAAGRAAGLELSGRRLEGRVRGFANYSLARARHRIGAHSYDAAEDRRHVANVAVVADVAKGWSAGTTFRYESGAPYTRVIMVSTPCAFTESCDDGSLPVMLGTMNAQRARDFASLDLMATWSLVRTSWSLSVYAQLRNVLARTNAVTYHSSCLCAGAGTDDAAWLGDRFDRGLPRLPLLGARVRF